MTVFQLPQEPFFPDVSLCEEDGLLAVGGDLSLERLVAAYSQGIFPWYTDEDPILWWSPDPRFVLYPERFHVSKSLSQRIQKNHFEIRFDTNFPSVIKLCAEIQRSDQTGTWITPEMKKAYIALHHEGLAHSIETYQDGNLVGGLYGVSLGKMFFGESMFRLVSDASKFALYHLIRKAKELDLVMIDSQMETSHMKSMGAEMIPRDEYLVVLKEALKYPTHGGHWQD